MRFSKNGYYLEKYIKCFNCGVLIYDAGTMSERKGKQQIFCSDWCVEWSSLRESGAKNIRLPLQKDRPMAGPDPRSRG
jgi:N-methylhydantoinase B